MRAQEGLLWLTEKSEKRSPANRFRGFATCCSPGEKFHGDHHNFFKKVHAQEKDTGVLRGGHTYWAPF